MVAAVAHLSKNRKGFTPCLHVLIYPGLDFSWRDDKPSVSAAKSSALTPAMMCARVTAGKFIGKQTLKRRFIPSSD